MRANTSAGQALGSMSLRRAVMIRVFMTAARSAPRSDPANKHAWPSAKPRRLRLRRCWSDKSGHRRIVDESREAVPAVQHMVDGLEHGR